MPWLDGCGVTAKDLVGFTRTLFFNSLQIHLLYFSILQCKSDCVGTQLA